MATIQSKRIVEVLLSVACLVTRSGMYVETPMALDAFSIISVNQSTYNNSNNANAKGISVIFIMIGQWTVMCIVMGTWLLGILFKCPAKIGDLEKQFPMKNFAGIGFAYGFTVLLLTYSRSGGRTPPYLHGILTSFVVPIQFTIRFILLRKKPTAIKITCAVVIILAELLCLIPTIFPSLEPDSAKKDDGGATGVGRILWPMCMVSSMVPFAIANTLTERSVQKEGTRGPSADISKLNLVYFQFWWSVFVLLTVTGFFWTDIIPGFGTSSSWHEFIEKFKFDFLCLFGHGGCPSTVIILGWANFFLNVLAGFSLPALMRYSEGANFVVIVLTLRTPVVFIFWSLFDEQPFHWHPHAHLGTWLSIGAISIMLPAVVCYDMGDKWLASFRRKYRHTDFTTYDDQERLVTNNIQDVTNESKPLENEDESEKNK